MSAQGRLLFTKEGRGRMNLYFSLGIGSAVWQRELRGIGNSKRNQLPKEASADTIYKDESD